MKYNFFILAFFLFSAYNQLNAQKGSFYIGGQTSFNYSESSSSNPKTVGMSGSISPEFGTFLKDNIQLGVGLGFAANSAEVKNISKSNSSTYGLTVYTRRFFLEGNFKPFVGLNTSFAFGKDRYEAFSPINFTSNSKLVDYGINLNIGFAYSLHPRFTVVGSFGFVGVNATTFLRPTGNTTSFNAGFDLSSLGNRFNIGVYYTLKERKKI